MDVNGIKYVRAEANLRLRNLGTISHPRLGADAHLEEISYRTESGTWYALHNVMEKVGIPSVDSSPYKIAFRRPYTKTYLIDKATKELNCILSFAEGGGMLPAAFQIYDLTHGGTLIGTVSHEEIDLFFPSAHALQQMPR